MAARGMVPLKLLKESPWNPANRISPQAIRDLKDSLDAIGLLHPVSITKDKQIIEGHRRVAAAKALGWKEIECNIIDGDPATVYASVNVTSRKMGGNDALGVWLKNPMALCHKQRVPMERMKERLGIGLVEKIYNQGLSIRVYHTALRISRYCDERTDETLKAIVSWLLEFAVIGQVMKAMEAGESPALILKAVRSQKPIKFKLAIAG